MFDIALPSGDVRDLCKGNMAVPAGILVQIILVIVFRFIEIMQLFNSDNGFSSAIVELLKRLHEYGTLRVRSEKHARTILTADIVALLVQ